MTKASEEEEEEDPIKASWHYLCSTIPYLLIVGVIAFAVHLIRTW